MFQFHSTQNHPKMRKSFVLLSFTVFPFAGALACRTGVFLIQCQTPFQIEDIQLMKSQWDFYGLRLPQVVKRTFESNLKNVPVNGNLWVLFLWIVLPLIQFHAWSGVLTRGYAVLITKYWKNRFQIEDSVIFLLGNQEVT